MHLAVYHMRNLPGEVREGLESKEACHGIGNIFLSGKITISGKGLEIISRYSKIRKRSSAPGQKSFGRKNKKLIGWVKNDDTYIDCLCIRLWEGSQP